MKRFLFASLVVFVAEICFAANVWYVNSLVGSDKYDGLEEGVEWETTRTTYGNNFWRSAGELARTGE